MRNKKLVTVLMLFCMACGRKEEAKQPDIPFDKAKWHAKPGGGFGHREPMIYDILNNYKWVGVTKDSVVRMLGQPDEIEEDIFMLYHYSQKKLIGNFPLSTQSLVFELGADSTVKVARTN